MKNKKLSRSAQKRISKKIKKLVKEKYPVKQAAAIAYKMERSRKYKKNPMSNKTENILMFVAMGVIAYAAYSILSKSSYTPSSSTIVAGVRG